jgi:hypothetical protein
MNVCIKVKLLITIQPANPENLHHTCTEHVVNQLAVTYYCSSLVEQVFPQSSHTQNEHTGRWLTALSHLTSRATTKKTKKNKNPKWYSTFHHFQLKTRVFWEYFPADVIACQIVLDHSIYIERIWTNMHRAIESSCSVPLKVNSK